MNLKIFVGVLILCLALAVGSATAQTNQRTGTAAAPELLIPVGARDLAMGGSSIATSQGVEALFWNPAGAGRMRHSAEGMFTSMQYIGDIGVNYGAAVAKFGDFGSVGFSIKTLDFGEIPVTTVEDPDGINGGTFSPSYITIGLTYGRALTDAISVGASAKLVSETIARVSASGIAFDVGLQYAGMLGTKGLQLGIIVKNIGPAMKFDGSGLLRDALASGGSRPVQPYKSEAASFELPSTIEMGLAYTGYSEDNASIYTVSAAYVNNNLYLDQYRLGGEYCHNMESVKLFGRAGYEIVPQLDAAKDNVFGLSLGAGISYMAGDVELTFDYAFRNTQFFQNNNVFSLKLGF